MNNIINKNKKLIISFYKKYKKIILYLLFGGITVIISITTYELFTFFLNIDAMISNILSWITAVTFAYITNRKWVFQSSISTPFEIIREMFFFFSSRVITLIIEEIIIFIFIKQLHFNNILIKTIAQIIVVLLNYLFSKLWIFKKD